MNPPSNNRTMLGPMAATLVVAFALLAGSSVAANAEMAPDFALVDVNETSSTYNRSISPRDYLQQVSGWYFGHAT